ncbi:MAG: phosphoglucosamine mutase [Acidobacteriota bacterium]
MSPSSRLFGTDGIRAPFGTPPLDRRTISALAHALGAKLRAARADGALPIVILGGDTRESTPEICAWLASGLVPEGVEVRYEEDIPTPGIAYLVRRHGAACGIAVSASHNPVPDNGVKLIDGEGFKWTEEAEAELESELLAIRDAPDFAPKAVTALKRYKGLVYEYLDALYGDLPGKKTLAGLKLAIDCGNGAASDFGNALFGGIGATVQVINDRPNGTNINAGCGSTHPEVVASRVLEIGADMGLAFDGDADRCILVDERGEVRDGDAILYLWARDLAAKGELPHRKIVATSMSNLGLVRALAREGIGVVRCDVGDRQVVATMKAEGIVLGGEQSGHIVYLKEASTGDGLLTALHIATLRARSGEPLSQMLAGFRRYPQILSNIPVREKKSFADLPGVAAAAARVEQRLGDDGRLVLRYSGTEPLARIMIEGADQAEITALAGEIATEIRGAIGA